VRPIVIDRVAWSVGLSVGLSVCHTSEPLLSPAKRAEAIEMSFEFRTRVGPRKRVLGGARSPMGMTNFEGKVVPL